MQATVARLELELHRSQEALIEAQERERERDDGRSIEHGHSHAPHLDHGRSREPSWSVRSGRLSERSHNGEGGEEKQLAALKQAFARRIQAWEYELCIHVWCIQAWEYEL